MAQPEQPVTPTSAFEAEAYAYARNWAQMRRRELLRLGAGLGAAAAFGTAPLERAMAQTSGGHLRIARAQDADTLDPQKTFLLASHEIMWAIYDTLIYLDEHGEVYPGLALSWSFSDDNKTLTFKLRPNVEFHDGTPFNADAVAYTVTRHLAPASASLNASLLGPLDHAEAVDPMTVAYHYKQPFVPLFVGLGYSYCAPISKAAVEKYGDQYGRNPVGTGAFKLTKWIPDQSIRLVRNDKHTWATPWFKNKGVAYLQSAEYLVIPEDAPRIAAFESGDADLIACDNAVPLDKTKQLSEMPDVDLISRSAAGVFGVIFNQKKKPFDDVRVREALNHAVDKDKLIALALDGNGTPATSPITSAYSQYDPATKDYGYSYDPAKAKQLLADAGLGGGFDFELMMVDTSLFKRMAEVLQADFAAVGGRAKLQPLPVTEAFAAARKGEHDTILINYTYSDPDIMYLFFADDGGINFSFAPPNPEMQKLLTEQRVTFDAANRKEMFTQVQRILVGQAWWIPLFEPHYLAAARKKVKGVTINLVGFHNLQDIWIES